MTRLAQQLLVGAFLLVIFGVPISQALIEKLKDGERPVVLSLFAKRPSEEHLRAFEKELEEASLAAQKTRPLFQLGRYLALHDLGEKALRGRDGWLFYSPDLRYLVEPYYREGSAARADDAKRMAPMKSDAEAAAKAGPGDPVAVIADLAKQLRARGVHLLVVPAPVKPSIYPDQLVRGLAPSLAVAAHTERLLGELRAKGVDVLALHPALLEGRRAGATPRTPLYLKTDTHWSGEGVRVAARAIAARVKQLGWWRPPASPRYRLERVEVEREGDLPRMTRMPRQEQLFGKERVVCHRVLEREGGKPYEDDASSPVLLLGDSFSRIYQTDEPEAAGLIAHLAFELGLPLSSIVNDGGASTLVRQELARDLEQLKGKRLVIWVFAERDVRFGLLGWQAITL